MRGKLVLPRSREIVTTRIERLAQHFQRATVHLALIQEQHAMVGERDFARTRFGAATDEPTALRCDAARGRDVRASARIEAASADRGDRRRFQRFGSLVPAAIPAP